MTRYVALLFRTQPMLLLAVVSLLKQQHMSHMHRHWVALVVMATPYLHRALTKVTVAVVNQLCRNMELLAQLYELGHVYRRQGCCCCFCFRGVTLRTWTHLPQARLLLLLSSALRG